MSRYQSFCVFTQVSWYVTKNLLFHNLREWDDVPSGYSLNTHMFIFGWHPLVKYVSLWGVRHFIPLEVLFKTSSEHSDWNFRCALNNFILSTSNDFQMVLPKGLLWYLIVLRSKTLNNGIIRYSQQIVTVLTHSLPF